MQITEKWQLPPFKLGVRADEETIVELRSSRLAGLIGPIQRKLVRNLVRNRNNEGRCNRFVKAEKSEEWMARSPV